MIVIGENTPVGLSVAVGRPAVFLDRDGTLNVERGYLSQRENLELISGAAVALRRLREAGFLLIVITNQSAIARGLATEDQVDQVNEQLANELARAGVSLDAIYVCPHHPNVRGPGVRTALVCGCDCRKPAPGLVDCACQEFGIDRALSWMVGDHTRDIETARRAGLRSILVKTGHAGLDGEWDTQPDHVVENLAGAVQLIDRSEGDGSVARPLSSS